MINAINEAFGMHFQMEQINKIKGLPLYMTSKRSFYKLDDGTISFVLVKLSNNDRFGAVALEKQRKLYEEKIGLFIAYWIEGLSKYQRDSLMKRNIPFIADEVQLYLPFLGIAIQNTFRKRKVINSEKMMPITQCLFLYLIYRCGGKKIIKKQASEFLNVTKTSITRASEQLDKMGLLYQETKGKEVYMWTETPSVSLFYKAKPYLINPIQKILVIETNDLIKKMPVSGEKALSKYSMINTPKISSVATHKAYIKTHSFQQLDERWEENKALVRLELWKYNPNLFMQNDVVDPVSLYMTLTELEDERIEKCLEEMMEEYTW